MPSYATLDPAGKKLFDIFTHDQCNSEHTLGTLGHSCGITKRSLRDHFLPRRANRIFHIHHHHHHSLTRYNWNHIGVVTSEIAGHEDFVQCIREKIVHSAQK